MSTETRPYEVHPSWNAEKAKAHLASLNEDAERFAAIAEAFEESAEDYRRRENERLRQIVHCTQMFSQPNNLSATSPTTPGGTS